MKTSFLFHSTLRLAFLLGAVLFAFHGLPPYPAAQAAPHAPVLAAAPILPNDAMHKAAQTFLASLSAAEKARTVFPFSSAERQNMNFALSRCGFINPYFYTRAVKRNS